jgi:mRNA interferase MazF
MKRGELWWIDFGATVGHEQAGRRPGLIVSNDPFNASGAELLIAIPLTRTNRRLAMHVPAETKSPSFILCEQIRAVAKARVGTRLGDVSPATLAKVEDVLRLLLALHRKELTP